MVVCVSVATVHGSGPWPPEGGLGRCGLVGRVSVAAADSPEGEAFKV